MNLVLGPKNSIPSDSFKQIALRYSNSGIQCVEGDWNNSNIEYDHLACVKVVKMANWRFHGNGIYKALSELTEC